MYCKAVKYPEGIQKKTDIKIYFNGQEADIIQACVGAVSSCIFDEKVEVKLVSNTPFNENLEVGPIVDNIKVNHLGKEVTFEIENKRDVVVWLDGRASDFPLIIFTNAPEEKPDKNDENVIFFEEGKVYDAGKIELDDNQTIYIEEGAYVYGIIHALNKRNIQVRGAGILDSSRDKIRDMEDVNPKYLERLVYPCGFAKSNTGGLIKGPSCLSILFTNCENALVDSVAILNAPNWITVWHNCKNSKINRLRELAQWVGTDGMDMVSCKNIEISNCTMLNNDDCIVIKAFPNQPGNQRKSNCILVDNTDVENILVKDCIFLNGPAGNAIEIGHELRTESVKNIKFINCDVLSVHGNGAALSVHNGDRALVENVLFENIRIEHAWDKVFDFRVMKSVFNRDIERGQIRNIHVKDVFVNYQPHNYGYTVSLVSGFDKEHTIENVKFENVYVAEDKLLSADQIDLCFRHEKNIEFI